MYKYPYGDSQQLNLDWILAKLKELEASGGANLEQVSNALISLTYDNDTAYRRYDYAFRNGKLYRCLSNTTGSFDPAAWQEALIGDDLAVLTRWINAIDAAAVVDVKFDTSGTNGKIQQKYHDQYHDVVEVDYTPVQNSKRPLSSNAGYELNGAINDIMIYPNVGMFQKIGVIGDSFASGYINTTIRYQESWVRILADMYGVKYGLYATAGYSTDEFLDTSNSFYNTRGWGALLADNDNNNNKCGLFIICMGINDANDDPSSSNIGSSADIKADPEQNTNTFWGRYGKIIARLQNLNSDARIICCGFKRSYNNTQYTNYNTAIKNIAQYFSLPYINPADHPFFNSTLYLDNMINNHPTAPLYSGYASAMADLISNAIKTYITYFDDYTGSNTNPSYHEVFADSATLANDTITNLTSFKLQKGTYIFTVTGQFATNATGYRRLGLAGSPDSSGGGRFLFQQIDGSTPTGISTNKLLYTVMHTITSDDYTMYLNAYQNSGGNLVCSNAGVRYFKVG